MIGEDKLPRQVWTLNFVLVAQRDKTFIFVEIEAVDWLPSRVTCWSTKATLSKMGRSVLKSVLSLS